MVSKTGFKKSVILFILIISISVGCSSTPPKNPDIKTVNWATYSNSKIGVTLQYPEIYSIDEDQDKNGVIFRYDGFPVLLVRYTDEDEGRDRGLWFKTEPVAEIKLAGNQGQKYDCHHYDGPFSMRTVSYVIPYRDQFLGLEFRTENQELDQVQEYVLNSFQLN